MPMTPADLRHLLTVRRCLLRDAEARGLHELATLHRCRLAWLTHQLRRLTAGHCGNGNGHHAHGRMTR